MSKTWNDFERADLKAIPIAISFGWIPEFDYNDVKMEWNTPENVPRYPVKFKKGNTLIWRCRDCWQVADVIDNCYKNHRPIKELDFSLITNL